MTIKKKPGRPILSLVHPRLVINLPIETSKETEVTVAVFVQVIEMVKLPLQA